MDRLLVQLIGIGFVLLSLTLISGLWFIHDWLAQHLAHKTILSITAWLIFGTLLWGRVRHGWRGRVAIRWALAGYAMLILAYFGRDRQSAVSGMGVSLRVELGGRRLIKKQ